MRRARLDLADSLPKFRQKVWRFARSLLAISLVFVVAACGGGGGSPILNGALGGHLVSDASGGRWRTVHRRFGPEWEFLVRLRSAFWESLFHQFFRVGNRLR